MKKAVSLAILALLSSTNNYVYAENNKVLVENKASLKQNKEAVLSKISFSGNTMVTSEELLSTCQDFFNKPLDKLGVRLIESKLTELYRNKGYILSYVEADIKYFRNHELKVKVIEGGVNEIYVTENLENNKLLSKYLDNIKNTQPLTKKNYERNILLAKEIPGVNLNTSFQAIEPKKVKNNQVADLEIIATKYKFNGAVSVNNFGNKGSGKYLGEMFGDFYSLFGKNSKFSLEQTFANNDMPLTSIGASYTVPVNSLGTKIFVSGYYSDVDNVSHNVFNPGIGAYGAYTDIDTTGHGNRYVVGLSHPVILDRVDSVSVESEFLINNDFVRSEGVIQNHNKIRVLKAGISGSHAIDDGSVVMLTSHVHKGFSSFGASKFNQDELGQLNFLRYTASLSYLKPLPNNFNVGINLYAQAANKSLMPSEKFSVGGKMLGRGFDSGEISGDSALAGNLILEYIAKQSDDSKITSIDPYIFVDTAAVRNRKVLDTRIAKRQNLTSAGVGVRMFFLQDIKLDMMYANKINRSTIIDKPFKKGSKMLFSLSYNVAI